MKLRWSMNMFGSRLRVIVISIILGTSVVGLYRMYYMNSISESSGHITANKPNMDSGSEASLHEIGGDSLIKKQEVKNVLRKSTSNDKKRWVLNWNDEFNTISTNKWTLLDDANGYGNRSQHYKPENISIVNGKLKISILKQKSGKFTYTSGALITKTKAHFLYGKFEIRAMFPKGAGFIPAIWMLPSNGRLFPEIDIAEIIGQNPNELWNVVHDEKQEKHVREYNMTTTVDLTKDYHVYGIEWTPSKIVYTLDGKVIFTGKKLIPQEAMYLYINAGVGGDWVGEPNKYTRFPNAMLIDYVRYYVREEL